MGVNGKEAEEQNIRCHHEQLADIRFQDGGLPHVAGACSYQVVRASRDLALSPEGRGFTYNHAAMLTYWNGHFLYEYLGGEVSEHVPPSAVFLCISKDGIHWDRPVEAFPSITVPTGPYIGPAREKIQGSRIPAIVHHRMGFYTTRSGRLLMSTFYGLSPDPHANPNNGYGVGRVVREVYEDFSMSEVYFVRYNEAGGYTRDQVDVFDYYENSEDPGFVEACRELLGDRLATQQWWEEERLDTEFFTRPGGNALSYYTLDDKRVMGVFKNSMTSYTDDQGEHWSPLQRTSSIITATGKVWGQRTADGRYALVYNPSPDGAHRWPLAVTTGENGVDFYGLAAILPEIAPCRYAGGMKNLGAQYMRGISEANRQPEDRAVWVAYSVNKEDMWITRFPVPVKVKETGAVRDDMNKMTEETLRDTWNLYVPAWGGAELAPAGQKNGLCLSDWDPCNRVMAERLVPEAETLCIRAVLRVQQLKEDKISYALQDPGGRTALCLVFTPDGRLCVHSGGVDQTICGYETGRDYELELRISCREFTYSVAVRESGSSLTAGEKSGVLGNCVKRIDRAVFASKYTLPFQGLEDNGKPGDIGDLKDGDVPKEPTEFAVLSFEAYEA